MSEQCDYTTEHANFTTLHRGQLRFNANTLKSMAVLRLAVFFNTVTIIVLTFRSVR